MQVSALTQNDAAQKAMPPSISAPRLKVGPPSVDQTTQTVGLYYPSSMALQKKEQQRAIQHTQELANRDRRPPLTAISPGRGKVVVILEGIATDRTPPVLLLLLSVRMVA